MLPRFFHLGCLACAFVVSALGGSASSADDAPPPPLEPITVCEIVQDLPANAGKTVVVLGRFSYRQSGGRSLSQSRCPGQATDDAGALLEVVFDPKTAPKPAGALSVAAAPVYRKLAVVKASTQLAKSRFGSADYDRWAFVYGRLEEAPPVAVAASGKAAPKRARLVTAGEVLVVFVAEPD